MRWRWFFWGIFCLLLVPAAQAAEEGAITGALSQPYTAGELFGGKRGFVHPFLALREYFTDNLFNTPDDEKSEFVTVLSPGIWLSLPASREPVLDVTTLNSAPGGLAVSRFPTDTGRRFQGYALYRADINDHRNYPEEETVEQRAEGLLRYRLKGGLALELVDIYEADEDPYSTGVSRELDEFDSNLLNTILTYDISPKLNLRADYSWYTLDFDSDRNAFRDREDNALSAYVFYRAWPKVSVFLEYEFIDINYDEDILQDSTEHHYLAGFQWDVTAKSRGRLSLGYGTKDFQDGGDDRSDLVGEIRLDHRLTPKTSVSLRATRRTEETDIPGTSNILSHRFQVGYNQRITAKLAGSATAYYTRDSYDGEIVVAEEAGEREDDYFGGGIRLAYALKDWLNAGLGYAYEKRDSNFNSYDYDDNTVYISLTTGI